MKIDVKKCFFVVLCILFLCLICCVIKMQTGIHAKENVTNNKEEDMKIIKHNTEKLQTVFYRAYNSKESAKVLSQNLAKVGAVKIVDVEVLKDEEHLIVLTVTDDNGCKFWISTDEFGDLGLIKEKDSTGKLLLYPPEE